MKFKKIEKFDHFIEEMRKVIYPQDSYNVVEIFNSLKNYSRNQDGTMSHASNEALRLGVDLKKTKILKKLPLICLSHTGLLKPKTREL